MNRSKRHRPSRPELDLDGYPIRLTDLAQMVGWSAQKLRTDIKHGDLSVQWVKCGSKRMPVVERLEAARYYDHFYAKAS